MSGSYYNRHIVKAVAIINPISGAGADTHAAEHRAAILAEETRRRGLHADIHVTEYAGHARALARAAVLDGAELVIVWGGEDRKSTRLNSSHGYISYAVFCL